MFQYPKSNQIATWISLGFVVIFAACKTYNPVAESSASIPKAPDYSNLDCWAAHAKKQDSADVVPISQLRMVDATENVDVFYLHPTSLTGKNRSEKTWTADVFDDKLNAYTDGLAVKFQASIFNGAGRVFAPRYRQAHLHSFFVKEESEKKRADAALELAYQDVRTAFEYYLEHENGGRPILIAAHSQGSVHAIRLLREFFDEKPLGRRLVAAYLIGWPVKPNQFKTIPPCTRPEQTGCFCTWRTWERKSGLRTANQPEVAVTNPLNWKTEEGNFAPKSANKGAVLFDFHKIIPQVTDAEVYQGYLLSRKPMVGILRFSRVRNMHAGDLNLFYMNVRENAEFRVGCFWK